ncbi:endothelin-converting enzyme [[Emmonsia] crescens]|uniref:Endothelin-converting enzyme n=1 Tax=[Emmonsia] crescens TaxID=73230 RepID=A0A2B7ZWG5_9EURO|nr:endothelin-converting enzyme [Emmonsia crescens]
MANLYMYTDGERAFPEQHNPQQAYFDHQSSEKLDNGELGLNHVQKPKRGRSVIVLCVIIFMAYSFLQTVFVARWWNLGKSDSENSPTVSEGKECNSKRDRYETPATELCLSPECIFASSTFLHNMHPNPNSIDPCTNFDQLVCGGFYEVDIPSDESFISTLNTVSDHTQTTLRHILEAPLTNSGDENFIKLKTAYDACMNKRTIEKIGASPLQKLVDNIKLEDGNENSLTDAILALIDIGVNYPVDFGVDADETNPDMVLVYLSFSTPIGLPSPDRYNDTKTTAQYLEVMKEVLGNFGVSDAASVVDFEKKLAEIKTSGRPSLKKYSLADAQALLPQIRLERIISTKAPRGYKAEQIVVSGAETIKGLSEILANTPTPVLLAFLKWKVIQHRSGDIEDPKIMPYRRFINILAGLDPNAFEERWEKCIPVVDADLGWILSKIFIEKAFSEEAKKFGDQIILDIKEVFMENLKNTAWISDEVRRVAIKKVRNIVQKIGYSTKSPDVRDAEDLKQWYRGLTVSDAFFENRVNAKKFLANRKWAKLGKPTDRAEWAMTMPTVNAYYNPPGNEIVFPAGIMQNPIFYHPSVPQYLTYGAFGAVGGHELTHAFDNTGRNYDQNGNKTDWWDDNTENEFKNRANCFVDQYSNFTVTGPDGKKLHVKGKETLGENIADAGGLKAAFRAWKKRDAASPSKILPGFGKYTKEQLFFFSFGTVWCGKSTPERAATRIETDVHSPPYARILVR